MDWTQVFTIVGSNLALMLITVGSTITLFLWSRSEARNDQAQIRDLIKAIQDEMKSFHGRLERQDADFKAHINYFHDKKE